MILARREFAMLIIEFENVWESELVAALYRALDIAKHSPLAPRIETLIDDAEADNGRQTDPNFQ